MKICLINSLFPPLTRGGAETVVTSQAKEMREKGHEVFVISTWDRSLSKDESRHDNSFHVYRLKPRNLFSYFSYHQKPLFLRLVWLAIDMFNYPVARQVMKIIDKERPEVIYTHNIRGLSYLLPALIKRRKISHVHMVHDIQLAYPSGILIKGEEKDWINTFFLRRWYQLVNRWLFGSPDNVVSPSQWLMDFYLQRGFFKHSKIKIVKKFILGSLKSANLRLEDKKNINLLYVGQIEKHKGILFLVSALKSLHHKGCNIQLDIVGTGSSLAEAKRIAGNDERFIFHGWVSHEDLDSFYKKADLTVVPSLTYENAPSVIFESLEKETPVLASDIGGISEFIKEGENGWLFEAGDEKKFILKLSQILKLSFKTL